MSLLWSLLFYLRIVVSYFCSSDLNQLDRVPTERSPTLFFYIINNAHFITDCTYLCLRCRICFCCWRYNTCLQRTFHSTICAIFLFESYQDFIFFTKKFLSHLFEFIQLFWSHFTYFHTFLLLFTSLPIFYQHKFHL